MWGSHIFERGNGLLGTILLVKADHSVQDNNGKDGDGIHRFAQHPGDNPGHNQNPDNETLELPDENLYRADVLALLQFIRAIRREALGGCLRR